MSGDEAMSGLSIKLASQDDDHIKNVAIKLGVPEEKVNSEDDDWKWEHLYLDTRKLNEWQLAQSPDTGEVGLVYLYRSESDDPYFFHHVSIGEMHNALDELTVDTEELSGEDDALKCFSTVYYNGTDSPFKF